MKVKHLLNTVVLCHFFVLSAYAQKQHSINEQWLNERKNIEKTTVLLNNQQRAVPILNLAGNKIASISFGLKESAVFDSILNNYATVKSFRAADYQLAPATLADLSYDVKFFNTLIISVNNTDLDDGKLLQFITDNLKSKTIIVTAFGDVHMLAKLKNVKVPVMWTAQQSALSANYVAQAIIGGMPVVAKLPVNVSAKYRKGDGFLTQVTRLSYTVPEEVGVNIAELENPIDSIAAEAISKRATPSAVIMVVKDGKVIFNKAYGHHTYDGVAPTKTTDIYDLASITKVTATTPSVMRLVEQGKLNLDSTISNYIPKVRQTDKKDIKVRQVMLHQAGFIPFIPFFKSH